MKKYVGALEIYADEYLKNTEGLRFVQINAVSFDDADRKLGLYCKEEEQRKGKKHIPRAIQDAAQLKEI